MKKSTTFNKTITKTKSWFVAFSTLLFAFVNSYAQTNPTAQVPTITENFGTTTFTTLPSGFATWNANSSPIGSQGNAESSTASGDATVNAAIAPQTTGGCYGFATASNGRFYIQTSSNGTNGTNQLVGAIDADGLGSITIAYDIEMVSANLRTIGVELQYRVGTSGSWTNVSGTVYSHTSNDRSNGNIDSYSVTLPSYADNSSVVQIRWVTWRGSQAGNSSGIAIDNISITALPFQSTYYFRSKQSGNWNDTTTWEASPDNSIWSNAANTPDYTANTITISVADSVSITATDTIDQVVVNGILSYEDVVGSTPVLYNGTGTELIINGKFYDAGPNSITWLSGATWSLGSNGYLIRNRGTSSNNWRDYYEGSISTIPATAYWIIRKNSTDNPTLTTIGGMYYPNLTIENYTGSSWITSTVSSFTGSSSAPVIKGSLDIGGFGTNTVSFLNSNTAVNYIYVLGNLNLKSGSTLRNQGTGFQVEGDLNLNGTVDYGGTNAGFVLVGNGNQNLSGNLTFNNFELNKASTSATITLQSPATITGGFSFVKGYLITSATNLLTFAHHASVGNAGGPNTNDSSFVKGPVQKIGNSAFTFPLGKGSNYQYIRISAPADSTDAYTAEYFNTGQTLGTATDPTFDYVSTCEYFTLDRTTGTSNINVTLAYDMFSCVANLFPDPRVIGWDGTTWKDLGMGSITTSPFGGGITSDGSLSQYGAITLGNNSNSLALPPDTASVPSSFRYIKNNGQLIATNDSLRPDIKYYMNDAYPKAYFSDSTLYYAFLRIDTIPATDDTVVRVDVNYMNANSTYPVAQKADSMYTNYYFAHCPTGVVNVPQHQRLNYGNLYNRIDLIYSQNNSGLKYAFNVHPGGKPDAIKAKYTGADSVKILVSGQLCIYTTLGNLTYNVPKAFKVDSSGNTADVACNWDIVNNNEVKFAFPNGFNVHLPLIIMVDQGSAPATPASITGIDWSTYYSGDAATGDRINQVITDNTGKVYFVGETYSSQVPSINGSYQANNLGNSDIIFYKLNHNSEPVFGTFLGGTSVESNSNIVIDASKNIYILARTTSSVMPFPVTNPSGCYFDGTLGGNGDSYIAKFDFTATNLIWASYIGGAVSSNPSTEEPSALAIDNNNNIYIGMQECFSDTPLKSKPGAYNDTIITNTSPNGSAVILKFDQNYAFEWGVSLVKEYQAYITAIVTDDSNNVYVTGRTLGNMPVKNLAIPNNTYYDSTLSGTFDAYLMKFDSNDSLLYSTFIGGNEVSNESSGDLLIDGQNLYLFGYTESNDFPLKKSTANSYKDSICTNGDAFIMKFDKNTFNLKWSTLFGGNSQESPGAFWSTCACQAGGLTKDSNHNIYITGQTYSSDLVLNQASQTYFKGSKSGTTDGYLASFDANDSLTWSTYFGGNNNDWGYDVAYNNFNKKLYNTGITYSDSLSFPLQKLTAYPMSVYSGTLLGTQDAYMTRFVVEPIASGIVELVKNKNCYTLYPNPATEFVYINAPCITTNKMINVTIYNLLGQMIQTNRCNIGNSSVPVDISGLVTGIYFINFSAGSESYSIKLIKQ